MRMLGVGRCDECLRRATTRMGFYKVENGGHEKSEVGVCLACLSAATRILRETVHPAQATKDPPPETKGLRKTMVRKPRGLNELVRYVDALWVQLGNKGIPEKVDPRWVSDHYKAYAMELEDQLVATKEFWTLEIDAARERAIYPQQ